MNACSFLGHRWTVRLEFMRMSDDGKLAAVVTMHADGPCRRCGAVNPARARRES
jgi:hypothetical protein